MAGRQNRGRAAAGAINLLGQLMLRDDEQKRERRQKATELAMKFEYEARLEAMKRDRWGWNPTTGQWAQSLPTVPQGLVPNSYTDPTTGVVYGRPKEFNDISADEERQFYDENAPYTTTDGVSMPGAITPGRPYSGNIPLGGQRRGALQGAINMGLTESPAASHPRIMREGTDPTTGRRVGTLETGRTIYLDTGEEVPPNLL